LPVPKCKGSERRMEGKARFVFPVVITAIVVFVASGAVTYFNIGWRNDFVIRWWSAFAIGWPIAASTAYFAIPFARSLTQRIVAAIERTV
jgi:TRAP-type C4-dicarboxylate transport system permease small subunit